MRSSIDSLIRCVLSGQKRLLTPRKSGSGGRLRASIQHSPSCYKVVFVVVVAANGDAGHLLSLPGWPGQKPPASAGDPQRVGRREPRRLGLPGVGRGRGAGGVDAAEHEVRAGPEARVVARVEEADS